MRKFVNCMFLFMVFVGLSISLTAQNAMAFTYKAENTIGTDAAERLNMIRARPTTIDVKVVLVNTRAPLLRGEQITINLKPDITLPVETNQWNYLGDGMYGFVGTTAGESRNIILIHTKIGVTGSIYFWDTNRFEFKVYGVEPLANGDHALIAIDPSKYPRDHPPRSFVLRGNYPNPFNLSTRIHYELPATSRVKLVICDVMGREIRSWLTEDYGFKSRLWDGRNNNGQPVPGGVYIYRMMATSIETGEAFSAGRKMVLLK